MRRVLVLTFFALAAPSIAFAQDPVSVDANHYKVMFENDQVRVLRIHYSPKEKSVMHEHPASVAVFLNAGKVKFNLPDGSAIDDAAKAGQIRFTEAGKHLPENIGSTPLDVVLVELKGKPGTASAVAVDPVKVDPTRHKVEVENDQVRVLRIKLKHHDKTKEHEHPNAVAVFLTDVNAQISLPEGKTRDTNSKRGEAIWAAAEKHSVHNRSAKTAEIILVELK